MKSSLKNVAVLIKYSAVDHIHGYVTFIHKFVLYVAYRRSYISYTRFVWYFFNSTHLKKDPRSNIQSVFLVF